MRSNAQLKWLARAVCAHAGMLVPVSAVRRQVLCCDAPIRRAGRGGCVAEGGTLHACAVVRFSAAW